MKVISELKETSYNKSKNFISESRRPASDRFNPYVAQEQTGIPNLKEALNEINSDIGNVVKQDFTTLTTFNVTCFTDRNKTNVNDELWFS